MEPQIAQCINCFTSYVTRKPKRNRKKSKYAINSYVHFKLGAKLMKRQRVHNKIKRRINLKNAC